MVTTSVFMEVICAFAKAYKEITAFYIYFIFKKHRLNTLLIVSCVICNYKNSNMTINIVIN